MCKLVKCCCCATLEQGTFIIGGLDCLSVIMTVVCAILNSRGIITYSFFVGTYLYIFLPVLFLGRLPRLITFILMFKFKDQYLWRNVYYTTRVLTLILQLILTTVDFILRLVLGILIVNDKEFSDDEFFHESTRSANNLLIAYAVVNSIGILGVAIVDGYFCEVVRNYKNEIRGKDSQSGVHNAANVPQTELTSNVGYAVPTTRNFIGHTAPDGENMPHSPLPDRSINATDISLVGHQGAPLPGQHPYMRPPGK